MPSHDPALLAVDHMENIPPNQQHRLSRSPHPYHRHRFNVLQDNGTSPNLSRRLLLASTSPSPRPNTGEESEAYFDADHRKRRKQSSSPSDSGTEADDERGATLLGLPAPPTRLRKGLIGAYRSGTASPLLTPSYLDEEARSLVSKPSSQRRASLQSQSCTDEDTKKTREKFTRRRRAELIRRVSETILIGLVGLTACKEQIVSLIRPLSGGNPTSIATVPVFAPSHLPNYLLGHTAVVLGLYALYPMRIVLSNYKLSNYRNKSPLYIHIPAAFEPAPLLYPVLVPTFVGLLLQNSGPTILLSNLVLSIATIPAKIIPFCTNVPWYSSMQWFCTVVPVILCHQRYISGCENGKDAGLVATVCSKDEELLSLLYPLHQALLPVLQYITTTSLLSAELQLLSVSLINLLMHAASPPTVILKSILWIGGLSVYVSCSKALSWEVALARVPSWRFRQSSRARHPNSHLLLSALDDSLSGRLSRWGYIYNNPDDLEDSENDTTTGTPNFVSPNAHQQNHVIDSRRAEVNANMITQQLQNESVSSIANLQSVADNVSKGFPTDPCFKRQRRATLPIHIRSSSPSRPKMSLKRRGTVQTHAYKPWSVRSLSKAQAVILKGTIALLVYIVVVAIIVFAVKPYVSRNALHGREPIGWALGYLFGDIPVFRKFAFGWDVEDWIALPPPIPYRSSYELYDGLRLQHTLGLANTRLLMSCYCLAIIAIGLAVVFRLKPVAEVDTRRKVFHGMMVAMFLPTIFVDPAFVSLAFVLILAIFLLLDLFRASQLPPLSTPLTYFLAPYVDGRDHRGPVIVSHIFLLIGCAIPLWLSMAGIEQTGEKPWEGWEVQKREVSMISGVVCVGMGDAAASLIGRRYGRRRWCWSGGKSLEGSLSFVVAVVLGLNLARVWLLVGGWDGDSSDPWGTTIWKTTVAATGASLTEAVLTGGNDNVIVPIILWLLVRGLRI